MYAWDLDAPHHLLMVAALRLVDLTLTRAPPPPQLWCLPDVNRMADNSKRGSNGISGHRWMVTCGFRTGAQEAHENILCSCRRNKNVGAALAIRRRGRAREHHRNRAGEHCQYDGGKLLLLHQPCCTGLLREGPLGLVHSPAHHMQHDRNLISTPTSGTARLYCE